VPPCHDTDFAVADDGTAMECCKAAINDSAAAVLISRVEVDPSFVSVSIDYDTHPADSRLRVVRQAWFDQVHESSGPNLPLLFRSLLI